MRIGIETESREIALQRHLERAEKAERREGELMDLIASGDFPPDVVTQLDQAIVDKIAIICDRIPRERALIVGSRRFMLPPLRSY